MSRQRRQSQLGSRGDRGGPGFRSGLGSSRLGGIRVEVADAEAADSAAVDSEAADLAVPGTAVANWPVVKPVAAPTE